MRITDQEKEAYRNSLRRAFEYIRKDSGATAMEYAIDDHSYTCGLGRSAIEGIVHRAIPRNTELSVSVYGDGLYSIGDGMFSSYYVITNTYGDEDMEDLMDDGESNWYDIMEIFNGKSPKSVVKI